MPRITHEGTARDSEHHRSENAPLGADRALRQSEERLRLALDASGTGTFIWHVAEDRTELDDQMLALFGYPPSGTVTLAEALSTLLHPDDRAPYAEAVGRAIDPTGTGVLREDIRVLHPDGEERWLAVAGQTFFEGEPPRAAWMAGAITDVTERKLNEAALLEVKETLETRVAERTIQVRNLASSLTMAEHAERARIAQILHDDLQQLLYATRMHLSAASSPGGEVAQALGWLADAIELTRQLTVDLSPPILSGEGLADALAWLAVQMEERHGLPVTVRDETQTPALRDEALRVLLFQIVRELLFNVVKHAEAQQATVTLERDATHFRICVADDGRGIDPAVLHAPDPVGFGLSTIRERLSLLGGRMTVEADEGTRVMVYVPRDPDGAAEVAA